MYIQFLIIIVILILFTYYFNSKEYFKTKPLNLIYITKQKNNKLYKENSNYIFIHIPKNAGTSFSKKYIGHETGHQNANTYDVSTLKKSVAIIRNPYTRLQSCYKYFKMDNNYWSKKYGNPMHHEYCKKNSFSKFIDDLYNNKLKRDIHLLPQVSFLKKDGKIYTKLLRLENINDDFKKIFNQNIDLPLINKSKNIDINMDNETKNKIYEMYKEDFELLGYSK